MAVILDDLSSSVKTQIMPGIVDQFFKNDPLLAYLKKDRYKVWKGGPEIQETYQYKPMIGDFYAPGGLFNITKTNTRSGLLFTPRFMYVNVSEFLEQLEVMAADPPAMFNMVKTDMANAALTMSGKLACAIYRHGQNVGGDDRSLKLNGLEEALSDGTNASFSGLTFTSYGGQTRADVAPALNSPTGFIGSPQIGPGAITYGILEHSYDSCEVGDEHPVLGITTPRGMGFINEHFQPQQRIDQMEPTIGFSGIKFKQATIIKSNYCPGQDVAQTDVDNLGAFKTNATQGETFWWLNPGKAGDLAYINLYFARSKKFQFGFTGFKVIANGTMVAGQTLFGGTLTVRSPRLMRALYGIIR